MTVGTFMTVSTFPVTLIPAQRETFRAPRSPNRRLLS
jgi:hypothetical protein